MGPGQSVSRKAPPMIRTYIPAEAIRPEPWNIPGFWVPPSSSARVKELNTAASSRSTTFGSPAPSGARSRTETRCLGRSRKMPPGERPPNRPKAGTGTSFRASAREVFGGRQDRETGRRCARCATRMTGAGGSPGRTKQEKESIRGKGNRATSKQDAGREKETASAGQGRAARGAEMGRKTAWVNSSVSRKSPLRR